ncbi:MAG: molybdopterin-dependent oxidoreductase [Exiguobacterium profundum]|nr:MAG: molybdopterin-dependent oxidoreductase [Exiguobacterium profundum]
MTRLRLIAALALSLLPVGLCAATVDPLPAPKGDVVLKVEGAVAETNQPAAAAFDLAMLQAMDPVTITTSTIWTEGAQTFTGVPLKTLLDCLGASDKAVEAKALNDYFTEIPAEDIVENGPLVAYAQNGHLLSVRDKGPLWIVYPYDADGRWRSEVIYARSIWQLTTLTVLP